MKQTKSARIVTFGDLKDELLGHIWAILGIAALCVALFAVFKFITFTPEYESRATLYILKQDNKYPDEYTSSDFSLALNVVNDCTYLLRSHKVLDEVISGLNLDISYEKLARRVSTSNPDGTRVLEVIVRADTPEDARELVNYICQVGEEAITDAMGFQQVNLYEYGTLNTNPCNRTSYKTYILLGIIAAVLAYAVYLLIFILNDRIRTEEDVHEYLGLSVLGEIPNADSMPHGRYGAEYKKKGKYAYYSSRYETGKQTKKTDAGKEEE
jgi:capsular polysaccharide biosynthesis protein